MYRIHVCIYMYITKNKKERLKKKKRHSEKETPLKFLY